MRYTSKHYFNFGKKLNAQNTLINQEGWASVRCDDNNTPFAIPNEEMAFVEKALKQYNPESHDIINLACEKGFCEVFSVGCGCGYLEYNLKNRKPELTVIATDFNPNFVARLKRVFKTCDQVDTFNMMTDDYKSSYDLMYLFFRIDTELSNQQWLDVFRKMHEDKAKYVLIVATEFLTFERFAKETVRGMLRGFMGYTFCG